MQYMCHCIILSLSRFRKFQYKFCINLSRINLTVQKALNDSLKNYKLQRNYILKACTTCIVLSLRICFIFIFLPILDSTIAPNP